MIMSRQGSLALLLLLLAHTSLAIQGNPERGRELAADCAACHGADGNSPSSAYPIIAGQYEDYLYTALVAYRDRTRDNAIMSASVVGKSNQELRDLAAWYAGQRGLGALAGSLAGSVNVGSPAEAESGSLLSSGGSVVSPAAGTLPDVAQCPAGPSDVDSDGDGLADAYDAAPDNADEFVLDTNGDGFFEICNVRQLQAILTFGENATAAVNLGLEQRMARDYELVRDIDAGDLQSFQPLGNCGPENNCVTVRDAFGFKGNFDGGGYTIRNLTIDAPEVAGAGLFGVLAEGKVVRNVELVDVSVRGRTGSGSVVGLNFGTVYNCHASGAVQGRYAAGGLVGSNAGTVSWSHASATVDGDMAVGGLVGEQNASVFMSYATGAVTAGRGAGGLVGFNTRGRVISSYASGAVTGGKDVGGLAGINTNALIANSYATASVTGTEVNAGGLVGFNSLSRIYNVYATGTVKGNEAVGGLIGNNNGSVMQGYSIARVSGVRQVGALVGKNADGTIGRSYWVSALSGQQRPSGTDEGNYYDTAEMSRKALQQLGGAVSGWAISNQQIKNPVLHYCDQDGSNAIERSEQVDNNLIWDFGGSAQIPVIRCTPGGVSRQTP